MEKITIYKEKIPSSDPRLKRHINHDSRSANFAFDETGIKIVDTCHERLIPILDQGQIGACTGNAGIGNINTSPFLLNSKVYSPDEAGALKLYSAAEKIDGGAGYPPEDEGSSGLSIAKALLKAGLISSYSHCFTLNATLKAITKYPVIIGINWYQDMFNPDPDGRCHITGALAGGHEVEARQIVVEKGQLWFDNSWNNTWGVAGRFYLTWKDFEELLVNQKGDVIVLIPPNNKINILKERMNGDEVLAVQEQLNILGHNLVEDGIFGDATRAAVMSFQSKNGLVPDGIVGPLTEAKIISLVEPVTPAQPAGETISDIVTSVCLANGIEPELGLAVASCEGGLENAHITRQNKDSHHSTDRGIFQWNSYWDSGFTDAQCFDPKEATQLFCDAVKDGHLVLFWHLSMFCWSVKLSPEIKAKYGIQ
jgi:hypothetical protein